jgi:FkbM family methyltransferase
MKREYNIQGIEFVAFDIESSKTLQYLQDEFDRELMNLGELTLPKNPVIVDIGANVGVISFYLAKKYPDAKIYAYEPHPSNYKNLVKGIAENGINNVFPFNKAVLEESGLEVEIYLDEENSGASSIYYPSSGSATVETISLPDIVKENGIEKIDYLKIDCEGAEFDILEKTEALYRGEIPIGEIFVEIHSFMQSEGERNIIELLTRIKDMKNVRAMRYFIV